MPSLMAVNKESIILAKKIRLRSTPVSLHEPVVIEP